MKQKLSDADKEKQVTMCEWFCNVLEKDENFLENVWFLDEHHFLLSEHVNSKNNVYQGNPQTIEELKTAITAKIRAIPKEEYRKVIQNFARQVQVCSQQNGGHLEHNLGKP